MSHPNMVFARLKSLSTFAISASVWALTKSSIFCKLSSDRLGCDAPAISPPTTHVLLLSHSRWGNRADAAVFLGFYFVASHEAAASDGVRVQVSAAAPATWPRKKPPLSKPLYCCAVISQAALGMRLQDASRYTGFPNKPALSFVSQQGSPWRKHRLRSSGTSTSCSPENGIPSLRSTATYSQFRMWKAVSHCGRFSRATSCSCHSSARSYRNPASLLR